MRCNDVAKPTGKPFGSVDVIDGIVDGARVAGWVIDPDTFAPIQIAVYIDGVGFGNFPANASRPDVNAAFGYGANHGFDMTVPLGPGLHEVCVFGLNVGVGSNHLMRCAEVAADVIPPALTDSVYLSGLNRPWDMGFAPDGTLLVTEKPGDVHAFVGGELRLIAHPADVALVGEGGMMGVAVDPQFTTNRFIYTCFQSNADGPLDVRVVRWKVNADYTGTTQRTDIITGIPVNAPGSTGRHVGCRTRFGPDGFLWVTTGDAAIGTVPQNPQSLGGKVLRVDRNGAGAPGNPGGSFRPQIYCKGHRNPQGIAFRPSDGTAFVIEHGTDRDDEVNLLVPGGNYGWDPVPGYDESTPMTDLGKFPNARRPVWSSGFPTIAPSGATFVEGAQWGDWGADPVLIMAVLKGSHLRALSIDQENDKLYNEFVTFSTKGRLRTVVQGPDGMLYVNQDADPGSIFRVAPAP
jgi:glucose/arabinose dehydrogenase